mmetsp:Transcript_11792/g.17294  ORF Transcript_11792/g.17294 Transcript_11792/m.17294 type:complete len:128 (-) Transcript_11792:1040-1423(-)
MLNKINYAALFVFFVSLALPTRTVLAFLVDKPLTRLPYLAAKQPSNLGSGGNKINRKRREQLGIADDEDEYDLGAALDSNTDPFITKVVAGSFILVMITLLILGVVVPSITDYGEGICSPIQNGGRC